MVWTRTAGTVQRGTDASIETENVSANSGDLLELFIGWELSGAFTAATPTGWTEIAAANDANNNVRGYVYRRIADGGADDHPTITISGTPSAGWVAVTTRITGQHASTPFDEVASETSITGTSPTVPTVTTDEAGELLMTYLFGPSADITTGPSGWTNLIEDEPAAHTLGVYYLEAGAAGSYGGETYTMQFNAASIRFTTAYKPAAGGGGATPKGVFGLALDGPLRRVVY